MRTPIKIMLPTQVPTMSKLLSGGFVTVPTTRTVAAPVVLPGFVQTRLAPAAAGIELGVGPQISPARRAFFGSDPRVKNILAGESDQAGKSVPLAPSDTTSAAPQVVPGAQSHVIRNNLVIIVEAPGLEPLGQESDEARTARLDRQGQRSKMLFLEKIFPWITGKDADARVLDSSPLGSKFIVLVNGDERILGELSALPGVKSASVEKQIALEDPYEHVAQAAPVAATATPDASVPDRKRFILTVADPAVPADYDLEPADDDGVVHYINHIQPIVRGLDINYQERLIQPSPVPGQATIIIEADAALLPELSRIPGVLSVREETTYALAAGKGVVAGDAAFVVVEAGAAFAKPEHNYFVFEKADEPAAGTPFTFEQFYRDVLLNNDAAAVIPAVDFDTQAAVVIFAPEVRHGQTILVKGVRTEDIFQILDVDIEQLDGTFPMIDPSPQYVIVIVNKAPGALIAIPALAPERRLFHSEPLESGKVTRKEAGDDAGRDSDDSPEGEPGE